MVIKKSFTDNYTESVRESREETHCPRRSRLGSVKRLHHSKKRHLQMKREDSKVELQVRAPKAKRSENQSHVFHIQADVRPGLDETEHSVRKNPGRFCRHSFDSWKR